MSLSTFHAAHAPLGRLPRIAARQVLTSLLRRWLWRKLALVVFSCAAKDLSRLKRLAALDSALAPRIRHPLCTISVEALLHCHCWGQRRQIVSLSAAQWPLAHQSALRLRASLGITTGPSTSRGVAQALARHMVFALQVAGRAGALRGTLR